MISIWMLAFLDKENMFRYLEVVVIFFWVMKELALNLGVTEFPYQHE